MSKSCFALVCGSRSHTTSLGTATQLTELLARLLGISSQWRPSSSLPPDLGVLPPHCLKKNGTPSAMHWSRTAAIHSYSTGRAPCPDSAFRPVAALGYDLVPGQWQRGTLGIAFSKRVGCVLQPRWHVLLPVLQARLKTPARLRDAMFRPTTTAPTPITAIKVAPAATQLGELIRGPGLLGALKSRVSQ